MEVKKVNWWIKVNMGVDCTILSTFCDLSFVFSFCFSFFKWKGRWEYFRNRRQKGCDTNILRVVKKIRIQCDQKERSERQQEWAMQHGRAATGRLWAEWREDTKKTTWSAGPRMSAGGQALNGSEDGAGEGRQVRGCLENPGIWLGLWT